MTQNAPPDAPIAERFASGGERAALKRQSLFGRLRAEPLLPEAGAAGAPLTAAIAVMSFLAAMALAAFLFIVAAAGEWTSELKSGFTVQVKGGDAAAIAAGAQAALAVLQSTDGVTDARIISQEEAARLLEPWLGKGNVAAYLNVPALIEARVDADARRDLAALTARIAAAAPGAVVDDHGEWRERLMNAARSGEALAFAVFALIMGAAAAISMFAARAGLAANSDTVSILHLVGATDAFIANEVQRRFLVLTLRGSLAGLGLAVVALGLAAFALKSGGAGAGFLPEFRLGPGVLAALGVVPLALCLVTATTARLTVLKTLGKEL